MIARLTPTRIIAASVALLALLFAAGWATRHDPADKPYLKILGGGFMFNYREGEVFYGFTAVVQRPLPTGSVIEASFEDPAGGEADVVRERVGTGTERYSLRSPPVRGVEAGKAYSVAIRVLDREQGQTLWADRLQFTSQISDSVVPAKALTVGPGYHRNPS